MDALLQRSSDEAWASLAATGSLAAPPGKRTILGFGSLLSRKSAESTFALSGFRVGVLRGWRRVFTHASPFFCQTGVANPETGEWSSLSVVRDDDAPPTLVAVFEIAEEDMPAFYAREAEYVHTTAEVRPHLFAGDAGALPAAGGCEGVVCAAFASDEDMIRERYGGDAERFREHYAPHGIERVWRRDILPCRVYLRHCVLSARAWGREVGDNFEDATFLADRRTTVRQHLARNLTLMDELPPPVLASRYNGP